MAKRMRDLALGGWDELRYEPMLVRLRAFDGEREVVQSDRGVLVWEPRRVVPSYAVPEDDISAELAPVETPAPAVPDHSVEIFPGVPILPPGQFRVHSAAGAELAVGIGEERRDGAAYRLADAELMGYVVLDFAAFDAWREEEEVVIGHPRDPYKRIDVRRSDRHVQIESGGTLLADSRRPSLLLETWLPTRFYLPVEDVRLDRLAPSDTKTVCAYKGRASHWALPGDDGPVDVAWYYPEPLTDALPVKDMVCFYDERVDVTLDGAGRERPTSPWSRADA